MVKQGRAPADTEPFASFDSPQLLELATKVNHYSNNFMAEQLLRALGAKATEVGNWDAGEKAMSQFANSFLAKGKDAPVFGNASGLHDVNKVSTAQTVELLDFVEASTAIRLFSYTTRLWPLGNLIISLRRFDRNRKG